MKKYIDFLIASLSKASALIVFAVLLARVTFFYFSPDERLIGIVPDDAFYYIQLAKHRIQDGFWTFDGSSPATGFHILYGYLLVVIFCIFPGIDWRELYLIIGILATVSLAFSCFYCCELIGELFDKKLKLLAIIPFLSTPLLLQSTAMMESWLVVFFSTLSLYTVTHDLNHHNNESKKYIKLFLIGALGSLSRSDYGLIAGVIFATSLLVPGASQNVLIRRASVLLVGAVFGLGIVLLHTYFISGSYTQASAIIKLHWSAVNGHNIAPGIALLVSTFTPGLERFGGTVILLVLAISLGFMFYSLSEAFRVESGAATSTRLVIFLSCSLTLFGYILFYRQNSGALQLWYSSNFAAPVAICIGATFYYSLHRMKLFFVLTTSFLFISIAILKISFIPYPNQPGMLKAGLFLKSQETEANYGSWNAGIISYFSGKRVINLDGLTNDEVIPYVKNNKLFDYLYYKNIEFLIDFEEMFNKYFRTRGGYDEPRADLCIQVLSYVDGDPHIWWQGSRLGVFAINMKCNREIKESTRPVSDFQNLD
jgi:hypothetical protein